jgi:hypothetical protein
MSVGLIARRGENGTLRWRENPSALPRAYVVGQALRVPDAHHALEWLTWFDPRSAVILPTDPLTDAPLTRRQPFKPATYRMLNSDEVEIGVSTDGPCFLVVTDTWMPGWTATDNGRALPILRGNQAQRVVALSTGGSHRVVMRYEAPGLFAGAAVSCLSAAGWLLIGWRLQMRASSVRIGTSPNVA